jgi:hypothetical protein
VPQANAYVRLIYINSVWYAIGGSGALNSTGYRISSSTNLSAWTIIVDVPTGSSGPAINIIQGAGAGASTEILVSTASNITLHSTNNGTSFTAATIDATLTGAIINNIFYSTRTGLYYIAATVVNSQLYMLVSTTNTLLSASWTQNSTGCVPFGSSAYSVNANIIDTGTWVGVVCQSNGDTANFYYGTSYSTVSSPALQTYQQTILLDSTAAYLQGVKAMWLNNTLVVTSSTQMDYYFGYQRANGTLTIATGATCSVAITTSLAFPLSYLAGSVPAQYNSWSGITYFQGSYYAGAGAIAWPSGYYYAMFVFKLNAALTTFSCPVPPSLSTANLNVQCNYCQQYVLSAPQVNSAGTGIYWSGYANANAAAGVAAWYGIQTLLIFTFNGITLSSTSLLGPAGFNYNTNVTINGPSIAGQPGGAVCIPKWSSLLNAYVMAYPASGYVESVAVSTIPNLTSPTGTNVTSILTIPGAASTTLNIAGLDVLSTGAVVAVVTSNSIPILYVISGSVITNLNVQASANYFAIWEVICNGTSYLAYASNLNSVQTLNIYKLSTTDGPTLVLGSFPIPTLNLAPIVTPNLRRVFSYNGSFYLGDTQSSSPQTTRNSLMLTPNNGSFTVTPAHLQVSGDAFNAGQANTYTTMNTITTVNPTGVPAVFIPEIPGGNGSFTKVR